MLLGEKLIAFLLNDELKQLSDTDPNLTVLEYLRDDLSMTGTKEGCASGDCGACTVVTAELAPGGERLQYQTSNSCIALVGSLHGKQLLTVEHLRSRKGLHIAQSCMVDSHGSQCGFCTPGFVMSLFCYRKNNMELDPETIKEALGGNLCRCTGYKPILDGAKKMFLDKSQDQFDSREPRTIRALSEILQSKEEITLVTQAGRFFSPGTSDELANLFSKYPSARLVAGTTDLALEITQSLSSFDSLISVDGVEEIKTIVDSEEFLSVGAGVSIEELSSKLVGVYPSLKEVFMRFGSLQVRNKATIGGNLGTASPIGDMAPILLALDAVLILRRGDVKRRLSISEFFISYKETALEASEYIERVLIPRKTDCEELRVYKISKRLEDDISTCSLAIWLRIEDELISDVRIAFGGLSEIPKRAATCEDCLRGGNLDEHQFMRAMVAVEDDFTPISDFRASSSYRLSVSKNLLWRSYLDINGDGLRKLRITEID